MSDANEERRHDDGRKVFVIGVVERWVIGVGATMLVSSAIIFGQSLTSSNIAILSKLEGVKELSNQLVTGQAVAANELAEVKAKQAIFQQQIVKLPIIEAKVEQHAEAIRELKGNR